VRETMAFAARTEVPVIVLPGTGETFGTWAAPQIAAAYERGTDMPPLLGPGGP
jgi:hypothetical protein